MKIGQCVLRRRSFSAFVVANLCRSFAIPTAHLFLYIPLAHASWISLFFPDPPSSFSVINFFSFPRQLVLYFRPSHSSRPATSVCVSLVRKVQDSFSQRLAPRSTCIHDSRSSFSSIDLHEASHRRAHLTPVTRAAPASSLPPPSCCTHGSLPAALTAAETIPILHFKSYPRGA